MLDAPLRCIGHVYLTAVFLCRQTKRYFPNVILVTHGWWTFPSPVKECVVSRTAERRALANQSTRCYPLLPSYELHHGSTY